jgi:hypothetical protein
MISILNKTLPGGSSQERRRGALETDERNSAQSLRPTFDGWGPRLNGGL